MNPFIKKSLVVLAICLLLFSVAGSVSAQTEYAVSKLIPCLGTVGDECDYNDLLQLLNNVIKELIILSFFVATAVFAYAGFLLMTTAVADKKTKAKGMIWKVFIGYIFIASAWLIVNVVLDALLNTREIDRSELPLEQN